MMRGRRRRWGAGAAVALAQPPAPGGVEGPMTPPFAPSLVAALAAGAVMAPAATADTLVVDDATAANVTMAGSTAAWSRRADDGTYRLVVRDGGRVADAPVPPSNQPLDPDLGPLGGSNARVI